MADNFYAKYPVSSGGGGSGVSSLDSMTGDITLVAGTGISIADGTQTITITNTQAALTLTAVGSTPNANAATLTGQALNLEPASASFPGVVTTAAQTFAGTKTFANIIDSGLTASTALIADGSKQITSSATTDVELGYVSGVTSAIQTQLNSKQASGNYITALTGDVTASGPGSSAAAVALVGGSTAAAVNTATVLVNTAQSGNKFLASPANGTSAAPAFRAIVAGDIPTLNQNTTGTAANITASSNSTLTTLSSLSLPYSQVTGGPDAITALTGDASATGPGSVGLTLATVNANVGTFGSSTSIPTFSVNGKGLITAASGNAVVAPASTLTGTTLNSTVVTSSLTSVGTISTGTWSATAIAIAKGGTGQTSKSAAFDALSPMSASGDIIYGGASGTGTVLVKGSDTNVLTLSGGVPTWAAPSAGSPTYNYTAQTTTYSAVINDYILASSASFTITLPTAVSNAGKLIIIQHNGTSLSQVYTLNTTSSQTINGPGGTVSSGNYKLQTNGESVWLASDGANWQVVDHRTTTGETAGGALTITGSTTNPTKGTMSYDTFTWWRQGKYMFFRYELKQTVAGSAGSGDYLVALPANVTMDTTNMQLNASVNTTNPPSTFSVLGNGYNFDSVTSNQAMAYPSDSTHFKVAFAGAGTWGAGVRGFGGANEILSITGSFPVSGWQP